MPKEIDTADAAIDLQQIAGAKPAPCPSTVSPMLASLAEIPFTRKGWIYEPKMDGIRGIVFIKNGNVRILSRRGLDLTSQYPVLAANLAKTVAEDAVIDGEIIALNEFARPSFQHLQQRMNLTRAADVAKAEESVPVFYFVFDVLWLNGHSLSSVKLKDRKALLTKLIPGNQQIHVLKHFSESGIEAYEAAIETGFEGIVAKRFDSPYESGRRSQNWVKVKAQRSAEFLIGGFTPGQGSRSITFGSLLLGFYNSDGKFIYAGSVGTGFDDRGLADMVRRISPLKSKSCPFLKRPEDKRDALWITPQIVAEIKFMDWTRDGHLRTPVFLRVREDISPQDVVNVRETSRAYIVPGSDETDLGDEIAAAIAEQMLKEAAQEVVIESKSESASPEAVETIAPVIDVARADRPDTATLVEDTRSTASTTDVEAQTSTQDKIQLRWRTTGRISVVSVGSAMDVAIEGVTNGGTLSCSGVEVIRASFNPPLKNRSTVDVSAAGTLSIGTPAPEPPRIGAHAASVPHDGVTQDQLPTSAPPPDTDSADTNPRIGARTPSELHDGITPDQIPKSTQTPNSLSAGTDFPDATSSDVPDATSSDDQDLTSPDDQNLTSSDDQDVTSSDDQDLTSSDDQDVTSNSATDVGATPCVAQDTIDKVKTDNVIELRTRSEPASKPAPQPATNVVPLPSRPKPESPYKSLRSSTVCFSPANQVAAQLSGKEITMKLIVEGEEIKLTSLNKVIFPANDEGTSITKRDYLRALSEIAPFILPHLKNRPLTLIRSGRGLAGRSFFQKHWGVSLPDFVETVQISAPDAEDEEDLLCNNLASLLFLAQNGVLEFHTWSSRSEAGKDASEPLEIAEGQGLDIVSTLLNYPDYMIFDLDYHPPKDVKYQKGSVDADAFEKSREAAFIVKETLDAMRMKSLAKLSGKNGIHVVVPVVRNLDFEMVRSIAQTIAIYLSRNNLDKLTLDMEKHKRADRIFLDYHENARGRTVVTPYSPRAVDICTIAAPVTWEELRSVSPQDFTLYNAGQILHARPDPWKDILDQKNDLQNLPKK